MNKKIVRHAVIIKLAMAVALTAACNSFNKFQYVVAVANHGSHGVILQGLPVVRGNDEVKKTWWISPSLAVPDGFSRFDHFTGYPHSLPDSIVVTWRLAELSNCDYVHKNKGHVQKLGCDWTPLKGKTFRQHIDIAKIRASEAYARVGRASPKFGPYYLVIKLIFNGDQLIVRTENDYRNYL